MNKALTALSSAYQYGIRHGLVEANPVRGVKRHPEQRGVVTIPSVASFQALEASAPSDRELALLRVAAIGGLRQSELFALEWRHVLDDAVVVEQVADRGRTLRATTKTRHARRVPLPKRVVADLRQLPERGALVFPGSPVARPIGRVSWSRDVWRPWRRSAAWEAAEDGRPWAELATLEWRLWRHYAISRWASAGASALQCSRWAGHTSFKLTMDRYGFLFDEDERAIIDAL